MKQQHTLQPKLRFHEFEGDWISYSFKEIFNFTTGKNIKQKEAAPHFETPCVRYGELYYMYKEVISNIINYTNLDKTELKFSEGDEILLPSAGEDPMDIGSASALTLKDVAIGRTINILKPKNKKVYSSIFASYYINQKLRIKISGLAKGVSISNVYNTDLQTLFIKLPSLPEQQKIANYLSTIDTKINLLEEKKAQLALYKKAMMQKLFSQEIRFKDDNGNDFPEWEEKRLGDFIVNYDNRATKHNQYPVLTSSRRGLFFQKDYYNGQDIASKDTTGYRILPRGYFTYRSMSDDETFKFNINELTDFGIVSPAYPVFYSKNMNSNFLLSILNFSTFFKKFILKNNQGSTRTSLKFNSLCEFKFSIPNILEQQKIADFLSAIDESIEKVTEQITQTQSFKKAMLQQMFV